MRISGSPPTSLPFALSREHGVPLFRQLADQLRGAITDGTLPPGSRLDNEIVLANRLGISRPTVRRAVQEIVAEGLLLRRRGVGTRVVHVRINTMVETIGIIATLDRDGHHPDSRMLEQHTMPATLHIATLLERAEGAPLIRVHRLLTSNQAPLAVLTNYLPSDPSIPTNPNPENADSTAPLHITGTPVQSVEERLISRRPTTSETELLALDTDGVILERTRISRDSMGRPVSVGIHAFRGDLIAIGVSAFASASAAHI